MQQVPGISVQELEEALATATPPLVLDVREDDEVANSALPNILHIPLGQLPQRIEELESSDPELPIAVICRSGGRSARAAAFLLDNGFNAVNVEGGMTAWVNEIDPSLPKP